MDSNPKITELYNFVRTFRFIRISLLRSVCLLLIGLSIIQGAVPVDSVNIRVATINVHNYTLIDRRLEGQFIPDYPKPEEEKTALRSILKQVNADIVLMQEMGPLPFLEELQADLRVEGLDYPTAYVLESEDDTRHLAVLTRLPGVKITPIKDLGFRYFGKRETLKRGVLELEITTANTTWLLYNLHLKSRLTENDKDPANSIRRNGEATAIRDFILKRNSRPNSPDDESDTPTIDSHEPIPTLILGDFNDTKDSPALKRFQRKGKRQLGQLIPATDSHGEAWTFYYDRQDAYTRIDFLIGNPSLMPRVAGPATIVDDENAPKASDHRLIYVDLKFQADSLP